VSDSLIDHPVNSLIVHRRGAGYGPGDTDADVVGIWVARQRRRP
jgi:hypothetical protein